jgi:multisubunit Na+/H+ antiporter MnhF subunit
MTGWLIVAAALLIGGLAPALWLGSRGRPLDRLVGLELAGVSTVLALLALGQAYGPSSVVILPLTLVVLSFAGAMVFIRLLATR